jgi:hypothetical protein
VVSAGASRSIPPEVLAAYQAAAHTMITQQSSCHLPWALLAGIGRIESDHADNGNLDATGKAITPLVGPKLDGTGNFARIMDTDHGRWDGDKKYDRAVGPMQFLPETWRGIGQDGNGDGVADPENIYDATLGTAAYLCAGGGDLSTRNGLLAAVYRYNRSWDYVSMVLTWAGIYAGALVQEAGLRQLRRGHVDADHPAGARADQPPGALSGATADLQHVGTAHVAQQAGIRLAQALRAPYEVHVAQEPAVLGLILGRGCVPPGPIGPHADPVPTGGHVAAPHRPHWSHPSSCRRGSIDLDSY